MPWPITAYRIFIASPGGLEQERRRFQEVVSEFNDDTAIIEKALFLPIGWELGLKGMGRPQEIINEMLQPCDYFVMVLHDRWGTPPATNGLYRSGTEEEYVLARSLYSDASQPLRQILVLFKDLDEKLIKDPGPQLQLVLNFKKELEVKKELFAATYDAMPSFERHLRRHLAAWMQDHRRGKVAKA